MIKDSYRGAKHTLLFVCVFHSFINEVFVAAERCETLAPFRFQISFAHQNVPIMQFLTDCLTAKLSHWPIRPKGIISKSQWHLKVK